MTSKTYISQSRHHYRRYYRLVTVAVILMMAVLTGSLLLGDSVRGTLVERVGQRLGKTESIVTSGTGFMDDDILLEPLLSQAQGVLLMDGFVSAGGKLLPVYVWGVDADTIPVGSALVNEPLSRQTGLDADLVLHLPTHNLVPSGSLFVTQSYATQLRLHIAGCKTVEQGGNMLLKNEQTLPLNVFVGRQQLGEVMELSGKVNVILSETIITPEQVETAWQPRYSGLHLTDSTLTYDGIFIPEEAADSQDVRYFSYLANDIIEATDTVPYPFVTAVTEWQGRRLTGRDIILSDHAAAQLHAAVGDSVRMSYFLARDLKNLETREQSFLVREIVPLRDIQQDSLLMAEFPGLSHVERCADWDSDLPIRMDRIHKADEDFWYANHQTPRALVAYEAVRSDWANAFGAATALRFPGRRTLSCRPFLSVISPREDGLFAANNGTDFAGLFLALGFFIILSGILLMMNPLVEMFAERRQEMQLYLQLGFTQQRVRRQLFTEVFSVMLFASPFGVLAGLLYAGLTLWLLGNVWSGATHTEGFALHVQTTTLIISWFVGLTICFAVPWWLLRKALRMEEKDTSVLRPSAHTALFAACLVVTFALIVLNFVLLHSMVLFVVAGLLWIVTFGIGLRTWIIRQSASEEWTRGQFVWRSILAARRQQQLAYWTLSMGVFSVFAVGLNRPDFSDAEAFASATDGCQLYVDARVPIQYDLNNEEVRRKLHLTDLPDSTRFLSFLRHTQDEASCLNLNRVATPTVLAADSLPFVQEKAGEASLPVVYIDSEALTWSLMKAVGDTLYYDTQLGERTPVLIGGSYPTGVFHGNALMSAEDFRRLWPQETGVEVLLVRTSHPAEAAEVLATALGEYGLTIQTAEERLRMFFEVTDTYLLIFLTLGGLGMFLGLFSLLVIVRKNLTASRQTIALCRSLGFSEQVTRTLLLRQNLVVPFYAVLTGTIGSVISISANAVGAGLSTLLMAVGCFLILSGTLYFGIKYIIYHHNL